MPLIKQTVPIPFSGGVDTKTDPKQVAPLKLLSLQNGTFVSPSRIRKRYGFNTVGSVSSGNSMAAYKSELCVMDGSQLLSRSAAQSAFTAKGTKVAVDLLALPIVRSSSNQTNPDYSINSGYGCLVYQDSSGGVRYCVQDVATGETIVNNAVVSATAWAPKVKVIGTNFVIFVIDTVAGNPTLRYFSISTSTPSVLSSATTLATLYNNAPAGSQAIGYYDAQIIGSNLYFCYQATNQHLKACWLTSALAQGTTYDTGATAIFHSIFGDGSGNVWLAYVNPLVPRLEYQVVNGALTSSVLAATAIDAVNISIKNVCGIFSGSSATIFYEVANIDSNAPSDGSASRVLMATATLAGSVSLSSYLRSVGLASKPFVQNGGICVLTTHSSPLQPTYFLTFLSGGSVSVIGKLAYSNGGGLVGGVVLPEVSQPVSNQWSIPYLYKDLVQASSTEGTNNIYSQTGVNLSTFMFGGTIVSALGSSNLHMSGAILSMYDSGSVVEHNFHLFPEYITPFTTPLYDLNFGSAGSNFSGIPAMGGLTSGKYQYRTCFEWTDSAGNIHRSAPSIPKTYDLSNSGTIVLSGNIVSGSAVITAIKTYALYPGCQISGAGIPAGAYVVSVDNSGQITISANATATTNGVALTFTFSLFIGQTSVTQPPTANVTVPDIQSLYMFAQSTSSSNQMIIPNASKMLKVGMTVIGMQGQFNSIPNYPTITAISGDTVTVSANALHTSSAIFQFQWVFSGDTTSGSNVIANVPASTIAQASVGRIVSGTGIPANTYITAIGTTSLTLSQNATATNAGVPLNLYFSGTLPLQLGMTLSGTGLSSQVITALTVGSASGLSTATMTSLFTASSAINVFANSVLMGRLTLDTLRITGKSNVRLVVYRTLANGTVFRQVSSISSPLLSDPSVDYVTFNDTLPDYELNGNNLLYTSGGEVENIGSPAASTVVPYKNRLILFPEESPNTFLYSKEIADTVPVEFSDLFSLRMNEEDGSPVTAAEMDDKLIIFKSNTVWLLAGYGPANDGSQNDFNTPIQIASETGCNNKKSIVKTPLGLMYQSPKGIYLLDRSLKDSYIGSPVEQYNSQTVTSAVHIKNLTQVRFTMSSGVILVFDYFAMQWSVFTNLNAADSVIYQGVHTYLNPNGTVAQEQVGVYTDNGSWIQLALTTAWFSFAQMQGFQRVYKVGILGTWYSNHNLVVNTRYDFNSTINQISNIPVPTAPPQYQFVIGMQKQTCEAVQFDITENQGSPYGQGLDLSGLTFEVGTKRGVYRLPTSQTYV